MIRARAGTAFELLVLGATPDLVGEITVEVYDPSDAATIIAPTSAGITEPRPGTYRAVLSIAQTGTYAARWAEPNGNTAEEEVHVLPVVSIDDDPGPVGATDVRIMVPRVRRALEGAVAVSDFQRSIPDDAVRDVIADACSSIILYTGSLFGHDLHITARDDVSGAPLEYATSEELTLAEQTAVAAQAALDYFFFLFSGLKVTERIADEGSSWEYQLSANLLIEQLKLLRGQRDAALEAINRDHNLVLDVYSSFLGVRDQATARLAEPYIAGLLPAASQDHRFGTVV